MNLALFVLVYAVEDYFRFFVEALIVETTGISNTILVC